MLHFCCFANPAVHLRCADAISTRQVDELDLLTPGVSNYFENTSSQTPFFYPSVPSVKISNLKVSMLELSDRCSKPTLAASKRMNYRGDLYLNGDTCEDAGRRLVWKLRSETSIFNN